MDVAAEFEWYADWVTDLSPLYRRLALGVATDEALLDIATTAEDGQPAPQLFLAAVHDRLLSGADHPLREFYPTCTADAIDPDETDPVPAFREFCRANERRLRGTVSTRLVQTNAVGRSAVLLPSFTAIARRASTSPLALVEIGASAGLNLRWDRYRYEYHGAGVYGTPSSPVLIESDVRGDVEPPLPDTPPPAGFRAGLDRNPLDVTDGADARWLKALVIPDQQRRHDRLDAAIRTATTDPPRLVTGDVLAVLPELLAEVPPEQELCVFSTHTLYQLGERTVAELASMLTDYSTRRPIHWLASDVASASEAPGYRYTRLRDGVSTEARLAEYQAYGEWIRWLDRAASG